VVRYAPARPWAAQVVDHRVRVAMDGTDGNVHSYDGQVVQYSSTNERPHLVRFEDGEQQWLHLGTQFDDGNLAWLDGLGNILQEPPTDPRRKRKHE